MDYLVVAIPVALIMLAVIGILIYVLVATPGSAMVLKLQPKPVAKVTTATPLESVADEAAFGAESALLSKLSGELFTAKLNTTVTDSDLVSKANFTQLERIFPTLGSLVAVIQSAHTVEMLEMVKRLNGLLAELKSDNAASKGLADLGSSKMKPRLDMIEDSVEEMRVYVNKLNTRQLSFSTASSSTLVATNDQHTAINLAFGNIKKSIDRFKAVTGLAIAPTTVETIGLDTAKIAVVSYTQLRTGAATYAQRVINDAFDLLAKSTTALPSEAVNDSAEAKYVRRLALLCSFAAEIFDNVTPLFGSNSTSGTPSSAGIRTIVASGSTFSAYTALAVAPEPYSLVKAVAYLQNVRIEINQYTSAMGGDKRGMSVPV